MSPKLPLFTKKRLYGTVINLGKKIPILVTTISRQVLDMLPDDSAADEFESFVAQGEIAHNLF